MDVEWRVLRLSRDRGYRHLFFDLKVECMELSDLDRLEQSVKRAFERIDRLEIERRQLAAEKQELENRLRKRSPAAVAGRPQPRSGLTLPPERLDEIKTRLADLIERIAKAERSP